MRSLKSGILFSIDDFNDPSILIDGKLNVIDANSKALKFLGSKKNDNKKISITKLFDGGISKNITELIVKLKKGESKKFNRSVKVTGMKDGLVFSIRCIEKNKLFLMILNQIPLEKSKVSNKKVDAGYFQSIIESSDDAIVGKSLEGKILSWNDGAERLFGYKKDEVLGRSVKFLFPEEKFEEYNWLQQKIKKGDALRNFETLRLKKDNKLIYVSLTLSPMFDNYGKVSGSSAILRDITIRKEIERELRESEERFRSIAENLNEVFYIRSSKLKGYPFLYVSPAFEKIFGVPAQSLYDSPDSILKIILSDYLPDVKAALKQQRAGKATRVEYCIREKDGGIKWIKDSVFPIYNGNKVLDKMIGFAADITESKAVEEKLRETLDRERKINYKAKITQEQLSFLTEATSILNSSLNYEDALKNLAKIITPKLADWFSVDLLDKEGNVQHLIISNCDPVMTLRGIEFQKKYPFDSKKNMGVLNVIATGKPEIYPKVTDKMLETFVPDTEQLKLIKELNIQSAMIIPLITRNEVLGTLTFVSSDPKRRYAKNDLTFAENLTQRAAIAIDNAHLYNEAKQLNERLEQRVKQRTAQLESINVELQNEISERKKVEEVLRVQAQIISQIHDSVISTDLEGYITSWNNGAEKTFGYTAEELLGQHISVLYPEGQEEILRNEVIDPLRKKGEHEAEVQLCRKSGEKFYALLSLSLLKDLKGNVTGMIGYTMDITAKKLAEYHLKKAHEELEHKIQERTSDLIKTNQALEEEILERRKAEFALRERDQRLRASLEASGTGTFRWDIKTGSVELDDNLTKLFGLPAGKTMTNVNDFIASIHKDDKDSIERAIDKSAILGEDFDMEFRVVWHDGSVHWLLDKGKTFFDEDGKPIYMTGACVDITEMKTAEQERAKLLGEIEKQRKRIDNIISSVPGVVWETIGDPISPYQKVNFVNDYVERLLGYGKHEWLTTPNFWMKIIHKEDLEKAREEATKFFNTGEGGMSQYRWISNTGKEVWVETQSVVIFNFDGKPVGMRSVSIDITERKRAQKLIENSLREKEILLKEIHHRVKNNLQILSSLLNLQSNYLRDKQALEVFKESQNRIKSMALVHEKLYQSSDFLKIDFPGYVKDLLANLFRSYRTSNGTVKLNVNIENFILSIDDAISLGLIINELVSNSLKYAFPNDKSGSITVSLKKSDTDQVELLVEDNGVGLPEGFKIEEAPSLGMQLVSTLTEQLEGKLCVNGNNGVSSKIIFVPTAED